ncbi:MAG: NAD(P)/FAD-dependent oxidoreductase [Chloroflexi bacterium]|nr:NAD(P)/FAD-dependent oxidoreductase [Chloroflexota bacterium]
MHKHHVVIVGGGFGGLYTAKKLGNLPVNVTLIDRRNHHLFQPLLYQVATGEISPGDIASPLRRLLMKQKNTRVLMGEVTGFDIANQKVILRDGPIKYDTLVVAAGSGDNYFGNDQWKNWAPSLKTVEDATDIRRRILQTLETAERIRDPELIRAWLTFVVIGAGPTGVEMAGALAEMAHETLRPAFRNVDLSNVRIVLVQSGERVLPTYPAELSAKAEASLSRLGVEVMTGRRVTDINAEGVTISTGDRQTEFIASRNVLWAAGVKASPLGAALAKETNADLDRGGRVMVEPDLSLPGYPNVFVIGDLAHFNHQTGDPLPGVAQVAIQQGRYVGRLIERRLQGKAVGAFRYADRGTIATIGRGAAVADIGRIRLSGWPAWIVWLYIHLMYLAEVENRVLVFVQWLWHFITRNRSALLIVNSDSVPTEAQQQGPVILKTDTGSWPIVK